MQKQKTQKTWPPNQNFFQKSKLLQTFILNFKNNLDQLKNDNHEKIVLFRFFIVIFILETVRGEGKVHSQKIISTLQVLSVKIFAC